MSSDAPRNGPADPPALASQAPAPRAASRAEATAGPGRGSYGASRDWSARAERSAAAAVAAPPPPQEAYGPIEAVENEGLTRDDMRTFVDAAVRAGGLTNFNLDSFDEFLENGLRSIITNMFCVDTVVKNLRDQTEADKLIDSFRVQFRFGRVEVGRPAYTTYPSGEVADLHPNRARLGGLPYSAPLILGAEIKITARHRGGHEETRRAEVPPFQVSTIPLMKGSSRCHTRGLTRAALKEMEEDPSEPGGYFIMRGSEWVVNLLENIRFNSLHVHRRAQPNELVRGEFISQPGGAYENSSRVVLRHLAGGQLTVEINSTKFHPIPMPFFLLFRVYGGISDADIVELVASARPGEPAGPLERRIQEIVDLALHLPSGKPDHFAPVQHELDRAEIARFLAERLTPFVQDTAYRADPEAVRYLVQRFYLHLDEVLLPHLGTRPRNRAAKLRFLGQLFHKMLLVHLGAAPPADRDSFRTKRAHGSGISLAKAFKTMFNLTVVRPALRGLTAELKLTPWARLTPRALVDAFRNPLVASGEDLNRTMQQSVTSAQKIITVARQGINNRVSSNALERKNALNMVSEMRTVTAQNASGASKQTERADQMRRVHASQLGYICPSQSADTGEKVGMHRQLALTADVCTAGEVAPLKASLLGDPALLHAETLSNAEIARQGLARVYLNGQWLGCVRRPHAFVRRYRLLRRQGRVLEMRATVAHDPFLNEVEFWLDAGRLTRPLLIVDNNLEAYVAGCRRAAAARLESGWDGGSSGADPGAAFRVPFTQNVRLTPEHVRGLRTGRLELEDLVREGICEYLSPEEAENCLAAPAFEDLLAARHDPTRRYTHCDVPQALLGLAAHISPFANHTQPARVTYETGQSRQTAGWYCLSYPFRIDPNRIKQHYNEMPLVPTMANSLLPPNGMNTMVAYAIQGGQNQEDSAIINKAFVDRGGFAGSFYRIEKIELEKGEFFATPDPATVRDMRPGVSYEKLQEGFVPVGTVVGKGDALVGRLARRRARGGAAGAVTELVDRSLVYDLDEAATVEAVWRLRGPNDESFAIVRLCHYRRFVVGDKMCLTPDHEVLTRRGWVPVGRVGFGDAVACLEGWRSGPGRLAYRRPLALSAQHHVGPVCAARRGPMRLRVTPEHRLFCARAGLVPASCLLQDANEDGLRAGLQCRADAANSQPEREFFEPGPETGSAVENGGQKILMLPWLEILGAFLARGRLARPENVSAAVFSVAGERRDRLVRACVRLGLCTQDGTPRGLAVLLSPALADVLRECDGPEAEENRDPAPRGARHLPGFVWSLGPNGAAALLRAVTAADCFWTRHERLADDLQRLALHAGRSASVRVSGGGWRLDLRPEAKSATDAGFASGPLGAEAYEGPVYCLSVPEEVFYVRRRGFPIWTGNSSRSGNKSIAAHLTPQSDMPYTEDGGRPDIIINPHCLAGETPVVLTCGLARRIDSLPLEGGAEVWGWTPAGLAPATQKALLPKGLEPVLAVTLGDGRVVRATAGHPFLAISTESRDAPPQWVRVRDLTPDHRVVVGVEAPLDTVGADEEGWFLEAGDTCFDMAEGREKALAFARILGLVYSDGCLGWEPRNTTWRSRVTVGCSFDADAVLADIETLTGKRPTVQDREGVLSIDLPRSLGQAMADVPGMPTGAYVHQEATWPEFLANAPVAVLREFLGGLFGGDGHAPCLAASKVTEKTVARRTLKAVAFEQSATLRTSESMQMHMIDLAAMMERAGVPGCQVYGPIHRKVQRAQNTEGDLRRVQWGIRCPSSTAFASAVGFRFCAQKSARLAAATAYWRMIESVKRQHDRVITGTTTLYDEDPDRSLPEARALSIEMLESDEPILNEYYSAPPMSLINNRRRSTGRKQALERLDFTRIADPETFFREAGCLDWFYIEGVTGVRRSYIVGRASTHRPTFTLPFAGTRDGGAAKVYDISVPGPTSFVVSGVIVHNSIPTRMTIGQMIETLGAQVCARKGTLMDATAFRGVDLEALHGEAQDAGLRFSGLSRMYNGRTGEHFDAAIFFGLTFHQRLQKFVNDDRYAVGSSGAVDSITGQPLDGKKARGGQRIGEMENWVLAGHGAGHTVTEKVRIDSDGRRMYVCRRCGQPGEYSARHEVYRCRECGPRADIASVDSCQASIVFQHEMRSSNVRLGLRLEPRRFDHYETAAEAEAEAEALGGRE